ncbi:MAG: trimeric intracellular cation channel family protein [Ruminococcaceae bacterium]|nr:trimeric intracellular cation channel family protein [Oscillospiraceae bacterium]
MIETLAFVFELFGTVAFAISGAITGLKKKMDIFGVVILAVVTAVGGGAIRDIVLGNTPPMTFRNPVYALVAVATGILAFIPAVRRLAGKNPRVFDIFLLITDSVGLGIFTVMGIRTAIGTGHGENLFLLVFVGVVTGVGGGLLRDMMAGNTPYIFVKHVYASASLAGAVLCVLLWKPLGSTAAMSVSAVVIIVIRFLAAKFKWSLPKAE